MKFITRSVHSTLDYASGLILVIAPFITGIDKSSLPFIIPVTLGTFTVLVSLFTNYEGGKLKYIPFRVHLALDILQAIVLGLSPWLFGFAQSVWIPFMVCALLEIGIVLCSRLEKEQIYNPMSIESLTRLRHKWDR